MRQLRNEEQQFLDAVQGVVYARNFSEEKLDAATASYTDLGKVKTKVDNALSDYSSGSPQCDLLNSLTWSEWREGMAAAGRLGGYIARAARQFFLVFKLTDLVSPATSAEATEENDTLNRDYFDIFDISIRDLTLGSADRKIYSAPHQTIDTQLFSAQNKWVNLHDNLEGVFPNTDAAAEAITNAVHGLVFEVDQACDSYVMYARRCQVPDEEIQPTTARDTGRPQTAIQMMAMEAMLLAMWGGKREPKHPIRELQPVHEGSVGKHGG